MNLRGTWNRTGIRPRRLAGLLIGFAIVVLVVSPLARFFGIYDFLGFTCDAREKAALTEFPQFGTTEPTSGRLSPACWMDSPT